MAVLGKSDKRHLKAAERWLGLGKRQEASAELARVRPELRGHPAVLQAQWAVLAAEGKWELAVDVARKLCRVQPDAAGVWVNLTYALHKSGQTSVAQRVLQFLVEEFPQDYSIRYYLARYACHQGELGEAGAWLGEAIKLARNGEIEQRALNDPELEPLWRAIFGKGSAWPVGTEPAATDLQ